MIERLDYITINEPAIKAMLAAKSQMNSIDKALRALVELRVSQINGCAYCVDLHTKEARRAGVDQRDLDCLVVWPEVAFFTPAEKAALAWAEALTRVMTDAAPDAIYEQLDEHYSERQVVDLTLIISQMNAWNRLAIGFRHGPEESVS